MKRKASQPAPYETPAKLSKRSTTVTVSRKLSTLRKTSSSVTSSMPPPKWPSITKKTPSVPRSPSLAKPKWPTLVPTSRASEEPDSSTSAEAITEVSEEPSIRVPGLRRISTLSLEGEGEQCGEGSKMLSKTGSKSLNKTGSKSLSKTGSKSLSKQGSSVSGVTAVATLEKKGSVVTLDTSGTITTVTRLASGSSIGETTGLSLAPPSIRKELSKAASIASGTGSLSKKVSSIRVYGVDAPEEHPASLSRGSSKASKTGSVSKAASLVPSPSSPAVPLPPGGLIEIVFSFDTTGSMSSCINEVRGRVGDMIQRLQADIPGIRIAVIAHGDYCDAGSTYVIKWIDFGSSLPELTDFVQNISATGGGDFEECYELVLARAQTELTWTPGSQRSLVMIGDATPHPLSYYNGKDEKLDWLEEAKKLAAMDVKIYAVQALNNSISTSFYRTLASVTKGHHLKLDQFNNIFDILMVFCYNERGTMFVQAYEDEVRTREGTDNLHEDLEGIFSAFRGGKPSATAKKVLAKGAAKAKGKTFAKTTAAPKSKAKMTAAKGKPKAGAGVKVKGKTAAAKGKGKAKGMKTKGTTSKAGTKASTKAVAKGKGKAKGKKTKGTTSKAGTKTSAKAAAKKAKGKGVKSVKGRKPAKTAGKKKTKATKTKSKAKPQKPVPGVKRKFREAVKDEELSQGSCMAKLEWTKWFKAIVPQRLKGKEASRFSHRMPQNSSRFRVRSLPDKMGLRNISILKDHNNVPAVYEVAVQLKAKKRYVVFFKACSSWRRKVHWDTMLLNTAVLHQEVNAVLQAGGQIWLRRGNVKTPDQLMEVKCHVNKMYDYAWERRKAGRGGSSRVRRVKKCNMLISGNSDS